MIKCAAFNLLEHALVSLSAGAEDAGFPLYRLHDRNIGRPFRPVAAETTEIVIDQGGASAPVDMLLIPRTHNLAGMTLDIMHSDDGISYAPAAAQWTGAEGVIERSWAPAAHRYWKLAITEPASVPSIPELFLSSAWEWERMPNRPSGPLDPAFNVKRRETASGRDRFLVLGEPRRRRSYRVARAPMEMRDALVEFNEAWGGGSPFWLLDHEGEWMFGRLAAPVALAETAPGAWGFEFEFMEVLP